MGAKCIDKQDEDKMSQIEYTPTTDTGTTDTSWKSLYMVGGLTALITVAVGIIEIGITFLPGGNLPTDTVIDWFTLFQTNWFLGLRNLGLLNIIITILGIPTFLALYGVHRRVNQAYAALAMIIYFIGAAIFLATNRAFPMFELSSQYALATSGAQRAIYIAAGESMLSVGQSHTPGTFLGFFFTEVAGIAISLVMLKSKIFSKSIAYIGLVGFSFLLIFEIAASFMPVSINGAMIFAMIGGILSMVWYILLARKLFQLGSDASQDNQ